MGPIRLTWADPWRLRIVADGDRLRWDLRFKASFFTKAFSLLRQFVPDDVAAGDGALRVLERLAPAMLGSGPIRLRGLMPNGQQFRVVPRWLWLVASSTATVDGVDLGAPSPLKVPVTLGDFTMPQSGILAFATSRFW